MQSFTEVDAFKTAFNEKAASGEKFIAIFTGSINEATNESWCPDCVQAKPSIGRIVDAAIAGGRSVLKGIVTREEWRGNEAHGYRQVPFNAAGVPTVVLFEGQTSLHKVDDLDDFANNDMMDMFLDEM